MLNDCGVLLNAEAVYSDETENYRKPFEPAAGDRVTIRLRTGKDNVQEALLVVDGSRLPMMKIKSDDYFDYYEVEIRIGDATRHYYFELQAQGQIFYYDKKGVSTELSTDFLFGIVPGFSTPAWVRGAVMYQIYVDRFCNGDPSNDVQEREYFYIGDAVHQIQDWNAMPSARDIGNFYGGDLKGVLDKLDYLQELGVEVLYLNPIFVSPSNHKYDCQDYDYVDPHYGVIVKDGGVVLEPDHTDNSEATKYIQRVTDLENLEASNALFVRLVEEIHRRGMKIILDGVFNHCGSFHKWMDRECIYENAAGYEKGAYVDKNSPYQNYFRFNSEHDWPYNDCYDGWWGHDTLPKLCYEQSEELFEHIMQVGEKWVSPPYNADGWRLDVAADLGFSREYNHFFWKEFRRRVKQANPNAVIYAEHYGESKEWLEGDEWDSVMNYDAFMEPVTWFLTGMEKHSDGYREDLYGNADAFMSAMTHHMASFHAPSLFMAMNELSNHDHSRFLTRTNHKVGRVHTLGSQAAGEGVKKAVFKEAVIMQMTWPGTPTLYYGDEAGVCGFTDPDNRRTYPWGREDLDLLEFYKEAIRLHKAYPVLTTGSLCFLNGEYQFLAYGRFSEEQQVIVAVNNGQARKEARIPVWKAGVRKGAVLKQILCTMEEGFDAGERFFAEENGCIAVSIPPVSAVVLVSQE